MEALSDVTNVMVTLRQWEEDHQSFNYDPVPTLTRISEIIEAETENYLKMDPDPFDERHPSRADPDCALGHILKVLFRKDIFMAKLVDDYLRDNYWARSGNPNKDSRKLNIAACRLVLGILPGLETSEVFQVPEMESMILRLYSWAEKSVEPLQSYATGLLASAMEVQDVAAHFREQNARLVPLMLQRLRKLQAKATEERHQSTSFRPFAHLGHSLKESDSENKRVGFGSKIRRKSAYDTKHRENGNLKSSSPPPSSAMLSPLHQSESLDIEVVDHIGVNGITTSPLRVSGRKRSRESDDELLELSKKQLAQCPSSGRDNAVMSPPPTTCPKVTQTSNVHSTTGNTSECSNSSWAEMENYVIGNIQIYPPTLATMQMLILRYLSPMGEYQEFLSHVFEHNALELILKYINLRESRDSRLAFEAVKYLASLLCHKKFSIEFINMKGLQALLDVPRPSVAATGVSICLYYLAYCEDAMERVCQLSHHTITELVRYGLWLLECSHDSGRCHAAMFFGLSFQFRNILLEFDAQDGLRKLYNVISTLSILSVEDETTLNEDEETSARQMVRHVCVALKRYLEAHLCIKAENLRRSQFRETGGHLEPTSPSPKLKSSPEDIREQIQTLFDLLPFHSQWEAVDRLINLGGITLLLQIIAFAYEWNASGGRIASGSAEMVRSALDALAIGSVMPSVQMIMCDKVDLPDETITVGMNIVLGAAEGEIVVDADVQRAALQVIINCVCAPIHRVRGNVGRFSASGVTKKKSFKTSEELICKVWESVRENNGIMVLLQLMMVKTPITDADSIRALACQALAGLSRSEKIRQVVGKLPLFTNGQLQMLMRDPILQEKRQEHFLFQKYALELMERVSGKAKHSGSDLEISLANMHRANVVAQTKIQFNDLQLYQLIHQHFLSRGLSDSASALQKEVNLPGPFIKQAGPFSSNPFRVASSPITPTRSKLSCYSPGSQIAHHYHHRTPNAASSSQVISCKIQSASTINTPPSNNMTPSQPLRFNLSNRKADKNNSLISANASRSLQKQISWEQGVISSQLIRSQTVSEPKITLDSIITEYLTNQHALCKNPVVPCPQFNLFEPHKCPDPKPRYTAPTNFTTRVTRRSIALWSPESMRLDRRLVHSRFCPVRTFRLDNESFFMSCEFLPDDQSIIMGTHHGEVKTFNLHTGTAESTYEVHESSVTFLQANREGTLLLTSSPWQRPLSAVWSINKFYDMKFALPDEECVEFSKMVQDRIIGTKGHYATIYDLATGKKIQTLTPQISNQYAKNRATFNPTDELVLSDGVIWDVNAGKEIHKLDKLNQTLSGVFHPNGLEVVCNTEVWDLRTFHLLRTVPALDQCNILFSPNGSVIYTVCLERDTEEDLLPFESSFKTLDAFDYSCITTIDVKKNIYDLKCNRVDSQIAIVENQSILDSVQESYVRVYDVGRRRDDEDGEEDEDDDMDDASPSGSGSDDDNPDDAPEANDNANGAENNENGENENNPNSNNEDDDDEDDDEDEDRISDSDDGIIQLSDSDVDELRDVWFS